MPSSDPNKPLLLTTSFCPSVYYFALIFKHSEVLIEAFETYQKQSYRNRCDILSANGRYSISIPVELPHGSRTGIRDVIVTEQENWRQKQWRTIESAYNKSPFFLYYKDPIEAIFLDNTLINLFDFNLGLLHTLNDALDMDKSVKFTEKFERDEERFADFRNITSKNYRPVEDAIFPSYPQVFDVKFEFQENLSILDLLFNEGPSARSYLENIKI